MLSSLSIAAGCWLLCLRPLRERLYAHICTDNREREGGEHRDNTTAYHFEEEEEEEEEESS